MLTVVRSFVFLSLMAAVVCAQTSDTATVAGTVTDSSGAAVTVAAVELVDLASHQTRRQTVNAEGHYTVSGLLPGAYRVTVGAKGFRQTIVPALKVDVAKSYNLNFSLEVGAITESIEVKADAAVELQTLDATVGSVIKGESLLRMPAINRSAMTFFALQPLVIPARGTISLQAGQHLTGQVGGARADQNTFTMDGVDVSDLTAGTNFYAGAATDFNGPTPMIPVPAESVEEFRLSATNANATFHPSAGGQLNLITRRGGNDLHGSLYWYLQNNVLNANRWDYNRTGIKRPPLHDNRFGASAGGAVVRNKTFVFGEFEGRRLPQTSAVTRLVPTDTLKQGILRFVDGGGAVRSYDVKTYDPRGLGLDPLVRAMWNSFPAGNTAGVGDGLNTTGFLSPINSSVNSNFGVIRVDHNLSDRWRLNGSYRYAASSANGVNQVDIAGFVPGHTSGVGASAARTDAAPRTIALHAGANLSPRLLNEITVGDARNFWADQRTPPRPQVSGSAGALAIASNFLDQGLDVTAGTARSRVWNNHNCQLRDNLSWIRGKHSLDVGGGWQHITAFHQRDDKIVGTQFTALVYNLNARTSVGIPQSSRAPTCSATVTPNCIQSSAVATWNDLLAGALGMVDSAGVIATRDASLNPLPPGTPLRSRAHWEAFDFYANDAWHITPSFTVTLGLNYSIQTPPVGADSSQALLADQSTGKLLSAQDVFSNRRAAADQGQVWNPTLSWLPVGKGAPQNVYNTVWNNLGPHVSASWAPGDRKTVLRGGYSLIVDRINGSTNMFFPMLNAGFAQTRTCAGPRINGTCQAGADPTNAFRVGIDGSTVPLAAQLPATSLTPPSGNSETTSFELDPTLRPGHAHSVNLTVQRDIGKGFLVEAGYVGHFGRNLMQSVDLNAVPYFMKDSASGQTFAQAYDAVAQYLRGGGSAANVPVQGWFENQLKGASLCTTSCTAGLAATQNASFTQGLLNTLFNVINTQRPAGPITNFQVSALWMRTNGGISNYNAGFVSIQRRFSNGLALQANYTLSKSIDEHGYNQEAESVISSGYNFRLDRAPSAFDRKHVFNPNFFYELPVAKRNRALGGWYVAGIFSANTGVPLTVVESTSAWGGAPQIGSVSAGAIPLRVPNADPAIYANVAGSGGIGTSGNPASKGSGLNMFADPAQVFSSFRPILLGADGRNGRDTLRGLSHWNLDLSVGKKTRLNEKISAVFTADMINVMNHLEFVDPVLSLQTPASFGVLTTQYATPRAIQLSLRVEF